MFSLVHAITDNPWAVGEATRDVIRDFAADGVVYLELRTTPRQVPGSGGLDPNPPAFVPSCWFSESEFWTVGVNLEIDRKKEKKKLSVRVLYPIKINVFWDEANIFFKKRHISF